MYGRGTVYGIHPYTSAMTMRAFLAQRQLFCLEDYTRSFPELIVESAKRALAPLLDLEPHHLAFVEALDRGDLRPDLIFPPEDADRLSRHPHLLWKVENRRFHLNIQP
ncbi:MAG: hypothetical protein AMXMBFR81_14180 [Chthonomonas sp.]